MKKTNPSSKRAGLKPAGKKKAPRAKKATARAPRRKTVEKKKAPRAKKTVPRAPRRKVLSKKPRVAKIDATIKRYEKAARLAHERAEDLAKLAHLIGESAVEKFRVAILADWARGAFLRDIVELRDAFAEHPPDSLPKRIESFRLLPDALLLWIESRFDLQAVGELGKTLEIPAGRLCNYSYDFEPPAHPAQLIAIRIISCGWKRHKTLLIPPRVELADKPAPSE